MDLSHAIRELETGSAMIEALVRSLADDRASWRPGPDDWSALEVICHLYDEEREDFRLRLALTLDESDREVPPIDPEGWVRERGYAQRDIAQMLSAFLEERRRSIDWLSNLAGAEWDRHLNHPQLSDLRAGDLLAAWVAHDILHIRQLNELRYHSLSPSFAPYSVRYAGAWESEG